MTTRPLFFAHSANFRVFAHVVQNVLWPLYIFFPFFFFFLTIHAGYPRCYGVMHAFQALRVWMRMLLEMPQVRAGSAAGQQPIVHTCWRFTEPVKTDSFFIIRSCLFLCRSEFFWHRVMYSFLRGVCELYSARIVTGARPD